MPHLERKEEREGDELKANTAMGQEGEECVWGNFRAAEMNSSHRGTVKQRLRQTEITLKKKKQKSEIEKGRIMVVESTTLHICNN
jgi:hypothetical protein